MYYVIKKQQDPPQNCFIGFKVPKYIAAKNNEHVIFEFIKDGKPLRKWVKKEEIILLTDNQKFFLKIMNQFNEVQEMQQKLVNEAQVKLSNSMETFTETMNAQISDFEEIRTSKDVPCILKDL